MDKEMYTYGGRLAVVEPLTERRASYNEMMQTLAASGRLKENAKTKIVPFPSDLRSDITLSGANVIPNQLDFSFRTDQNNQGMQTRLESDNRLDINDGFYATHVALMFGIRAANADASAAYMQQFPNSRDVTGAIGGGFGVAGAAAILRAYNGTMGMELNAVKYMDQLACLNFMYSNTAQSGTAVSDVATDGITNANDFGNLNGWYELVPGIMFGGSDKFRVTVTIPQPLTFLVTDFEIIVSAQLKGLRLQNYESAD